MSSSFRKDVKKQAAAGKWRGVGVIFILIAGIATVAFPSTIINAGSAVIAGTANLLFSSPTPAAKVERPTLDSSSKVASGDLATARKGHTATELPDGKILIAGGDELGSFEIYDPSTGISSIAGHMMSPRSGHTASVLADGKILITGGMPGRIRGGNTTEIYDNGVFVAGPRMSASRTGHTATVLADGRILLIGGEASGSIEVLQIDGKNSRGATGSLIHARSFHSVELLDNGNVLIVGGSSDEGDVRTAEILDVATLKSTEIGQLNAGRIRPLMRELPDGKVQIIGGNDEGTMEIVTPAGNYFSGYAHVIPNRDAKASRAIRSSSLSRVGGEDVPGAGEAESIVLRTATRAALINTGEADDSLLNRTDHASVAIPGTNKVFISGGKNSSGETLMSTMSMTTSGATISTDALDYAPGQVVTIRGAGWLAGETVGLTIVRDRVPTGDGNTETITLSAVADEEGNFSNSEYITTPEDLGASFVVSAMGSTSGFTAQTTFTDAGASNPSPQTLPYSQAFGGLLHTSATYPAGWNGWDFGTGSANGSDSTFKTAVPVNDVGLNASSTSTTATTGVHNFNGKIGFLSGNTQDTSLVLAINTSGNTNISVGFDVMTIRNPYNTTTATRINEVDLQYRICPANPVDSCTSTFSSLSASAGIYQNNTVFQGAPATTNPQKLESKNIPLPVAAEGQSNVQLRWVQRDVSGSGARPSFAVDNLNVSGTAAQTTPVITFDSAPTPVFGDNFVVSATTTNTDSSALTYSYVSGPCSFVSGSTFTATGVGTCVVQADGAATAGFFAASNTQSVTIGKASTTTTVTCPTNVTYTGAALTPCSVSVTGAGGLNLTPTPTYTNNTNAGTANASYTYVESANHLGSSDSQDFTIDKAPTLTTITFEAGPYVYRGSAFTATAVVTGPNSLNSPLTVSYSGDCINVTVANGCTASATYAESANYLGSTDSKSITITKANQAALTLNTTSPMVYLGTQTMSVTGGNTNGTVTYNLVSGPCSIVVNVLTAMGSSGSCSVTATMAGDSNYNSVTSTPANVVSLAPRKALVRYIGQLEWVTSGTSATSAQVTLAASVQDPTGYALAGATMSFLNAETNQVIAANVPVAPVAGQPDTGTASKIVTLSTGQYGAATYLIKVVMTGPYTNYHQPVPDKTASLVVIKATGANQATGGGSLDVLSSSAGTFGFSADAAKCVTFSVGMEYNRNMTNVKGKIFITIPQSDGSIVHINSNAVNSMVKTGSGSTTVVTIYTKSNVVRVTESGSENIEGNVSLRMDITGTGPTSKVGFTVLSSSTSNMFYSNNWVLSNQTWNTVPQLIKSGSITAN